MMPLDVRRVTLYATATLFTFPSAFAQESNDNGVSAADENPSGEECLGFEAHPFTFFVLFSAMMVVPFYLLATYAFSKASVQSGFILGCIWLIFVAGMACFSLFDVAGQLGTAGNLIVPAAWFLPSFLLFLSRKRFVYNNPLSQKWMVGLQLWRSIGGLFLIEMARGNLAPIFAYAAGIGDFLVALDAAVTLIWYRKADRIPAKAVYFLIVIGVLDFLSAFFFGFFSSENDVQLFYHDAAYDATKYPTGLIPFSLVPCAIFFHILSFLTQREFGDIQDPSCASSNQLEKGPSNIEAGDDGKHSRVHQDASE